MKVHPSLFCLAIGIALISAPAVFAHDEVGEVIRDSIELPLVLPRILLGAALAPPERVVVVERPVYGRPVYGRPYGWRGPAYWHDGRPYGYRDGERPLPPRGSWGRR